MKTVPVRLLMLAVLLAPTALGGEGKEKADGAQKTTAKAKEKGVPRPGPKADFKTNLAWQIALDGVHFSPGILDGNWGRKGEMALSLYSMDYGIHMESEPDAYAMLAHSLELNIEHPTAIYTIGAADMAEIGELSEDWNERAKLDRLRYPTLLECLAEKFHCTQALLIRLNPGVTINALKPDASLTAPNLRPFPKPGPLPHPKINMGKEPYHLSIDLSQKTIRVIPEEHRGIPIALFHCSVAKDKEKLPGRDAKIVNMASPPNYTFDPAGWPDVKNVDHKLVIAAGPRNPVGLAWIGLDLPGYGMHGNPKPELIGKTGSHGCFRLTNWDALALFGMAKVGMKVEIVGAPAKEHERAPEKADGKKPE